MISWRNLCFNQILYFKFYKFLPVPLSPILLRYFEVQRGTQGGLEQSGPYSGNPGLILKVNSTLLYINANFDAIYQNHSFQYLHFFTNTASNKNIYISSLNIYIMFTKIVLLPSMYLPCAIQTAKLSTDSWSSSSRDAP